MTALGLNPFRPTRWEHQSDGRPLIWFTDAAASLAVDKSVYVFGSRGSGKTSLLKGICWTDLLFNESLKIQHNLTDFDHIGIYIRFPDHISVSMSYDNWVQIFPKAPDPDIEAYKFFSLAVELVCIERVLEAVQELRMAGYIKYSAKTELALVDQFAQEFRFDKFCGEHRLPITFIDLARTAREIIREMNQACGRGTVEEVLPALPLREPYQLLSYLLERLAASARLRSPTGCRPPSFKFCLDDCEVLNGIQRKSLNSLVRLSKAPVSWVVSSVGRPRDHTDTFINSQPLTDADRRVFSLDARGGEDFAELCQAVVSLRLLFSLPVQTREDIAPERVPSFFDLKMRLGHRDVNDMIYAMLRRSISGEARALLTTAERLRTALMSGIGGKNVRANAKSHARTNKLPLYETYVFLRSQNSDEGTGYRRMAGGIDLADYASRFGDPEFNAWLRRKQRAALIQLADSLGIKRIPLSGSNVVTALADGSIRDFLEIMGEIFDAYVTANGWGASDTRNFERFARQSTTIPDSIQTTGIYRASEAYFAGIEHQPDIDPDIIARLVAGLGRYTHILQAKAQEGEGIATAEHGIFVINYDSLSRYDDAQARADLVDAAFRQAELAGYLRSVSSRRGRLRAGGRVLDPLSAFRLHCRFAPYFGFSYRGAYEDVAVKADDIVSLCRSDPPVDPVQWAERLAGYQSEPKNTQQIPLPFSDGAP